MKKANHGAIRHYVACDARLYAQFLDQSISAADHLATSAALSVAIHYLAENTDLAEFKAALAVGGRNDK